MISVTSSEGKRDQVASLSSPPPRTWATRSTSSSTSSAFQDPHADGPVAIESASVSAASSSSTSWCNGLGHTGDGGVVAQVAPCGDVGQEEVQADEGSEDLDVPRRQPHAMSDAVNELDADQRVVAGIALSEVVEQRTQDEQVRPVDTVSQPRGIGRRLPQVPVDGEAVVGVALRAGPDGLTREARG